MDLYFDTYREAQEWKKKLRDRGFKAFVFENTFTVRTDASSEDIEKIKHQQDLETIIKIIHTRVSDTLNHVGYAPFTLSDNIEMFYTLQAVEEMIKDIDE